MDKPIILWFRRDLRMRDHEALTAAATSGRPVIPVFIHDNAVATLGAAPKWRLGLSLAQLTKDLAEKNSTLILRRGNALEALRQLIKETGATSVYWSRAYDPDSIERDTMIKSDLKNDGIEARSFIGHVLFEPMSVETKTGGFYKVFTPMWKNVRTREVPDELHVPQKITAPATVPNSEELDSWSMGDAMQRGIDVVLPYTCVGQDKAKDRLQAFCDGPIGDYTTNRDLPWKKRGTSGLSENLALGEISPRQCWHAGWAKVNEGIEDAEVFVKEVVWREFAYHLAYHTPRILTDNWKPDWDGFDWNEDETTPEVIAWKQGRTGIQFVDAAMREMYVTGTMHNRGRMIVASYLTKHLLCHWKIGMNWFAECLIDWDPASNAMGWQWSSGSGPDATPYFRVFNPVTQLDKFDKSRTYVNTWIAEGHSNPAPEALAYFDAIPRSWDIAAKDTYPDPIVSAADGRTRALQAYENRGF